IVSFSRCLRVHRDTHSFPTRRSSDLGASKGIGKAIACAFAREGASVAVCARTAEELEHTRQELERIAPGREHLAVQADCSDKTRSEEHTSELQSRENLVCRLLLEKKK